MCGRDVRGVVYAAGRSLNRDNSVLLVDRRGRCRGLCRLTGKVGSLTFRGGTDDPGWRSCWHGGRSKRNGQTQTGDAQVSGANDSSEEADDDAEPTSTLHNFDPTRSLID